MPQASSDDDQNTVATAWRADLLQRFAWILCLGSAPLVLYLIFLSPPLGPPLRPADVVALCAIPLGAAVVFAAARVDLRVRGAVLILALQAFASRGASHWGPVPGVLACSMVAAVLAALLFGRGVGAAVLALGAASLLGFGYASGNANPLAWAGRLSELQAWIRIALVYALLTGTVQLLVSGAVRRVETSLAEARTALAAAMRERQGRADAEQALRENEERLRRALDAARLGTWEWNVTDGSVVWEGHAKSVLGVPPGAPATIQTFRETIHPEDRPLVERAIQAALAGPDGELREEHRTTDDPPRWLRGRGRLHRDEAGRPLRMLGTVEDVTPEKLAEERLHASEERWRRISEATFEGIGFSQDGVIVDVNLQLADMLGYTPQELVGRPVLDVVAPEDRERVLRALRGGQSGAYEHNALRKDGSRVLVETRAHSLRAGDRQLRVTAVRDVSERSRLESELRRRERLAAIGALVGGVAHEVRNPLFGISATLDALDVRPPGRDDRDLKQRLRSQVARLSDLMRDLLDYGRPPRLRLQPAVLAEVVRSAAQRCLPLAEGSGVRIAPELPLDLPELTLDVGRIEQVFENLIANAVQHSPRDRTVSVSAVWREAPCAGLSVLVEDEGPGLQAGESQLVFEPFFSRRRGGTGLGLAIAQRLVEAHGGTLVAGNRHGGGAVFTVFLPRDSPQAEVRDS